ncbi:hypothetical protein [Streptomyces griseoluteus]|uniref:hypothetical protein n=1 Tax=Streptomyces griseoluteus TaxID=29306 RepID=UPI0036F8D128
MSRVDRRKASTRGIDFRTRTRFDGKTRAVHGEIEATVHQSKMRSLMCLSQPACELGAIGNSGGYRPRPPGPTGREDNDRAEAGHHRVTRCGKGDGA